MKIYLFYPEKIYSFILPKEIEGSFSFDADKNETTKLINVEAKDGKWIIYSIEDVNVIENNNSIVNTQLKKDNYYLIERNNSKYLIYVTELTKDKFDIYSYENFNIIIGNTNNSNIKYNCPYLGQNEVKIYKDINGIILEQNQAVCYKNNNIIKETKHNLQIGDYINIYGLKIIILNNLILINNPSGNINIPSLNFGINKYQFVKDEPPKKVAIQDKDLYDKKSFFSKAPRIRRVIETKHIKLSPPPQSGEGQELPFILTIGPMVTMGIISCVNMIQIFTRIGSGETTFSKSWPQLLTTFAMLTSMLLWPLIMNFYNKKTQKKHKQQLIAKYDEYLKSREKDVEDEVHLQKDILTENLITTNECLEIIGKKNIGFWDKRVDQSDFLVARLGIGRFPLDINIEYPEEGFTINEDELRKKADEMVERYKYINNVPVGYSFYENKITAVMSSSKEKSFSFVDNILLQLLTFYSYEDLKLVIFTNEENKSRWDYARYLNHNFTNDRRFRFFASNSDSAKMVMEFLSMAKANKENENMNAKKDTPKKPYYLIIIDDYDLIKRFDFINDITEADENLDFSIIIIEEKLSKLPSKCNNFISLGSGDSTILKNSYEKQEQISFKDEINNNINMMNISKIISNIPIEFEDGLKALPESVNYLEMLDVGKVEQLNVLNRWNTSNPTNSLRAEIGIDEQGDIMYLDLHEKHHGPHGLIAGTTGSGKSEFIITYILSMCINYSPDDISFILIDYKGGGLALAFENKTAGISLPHLAGTITNLDKAEMDRTLVSIDSEVKRRQKMFNEAREAAGESTMDIYKYQLLYKEGRIKEPIPHLFIICDEFAELKAQQPDFMDNLISVARIGRSLGVHLILATQKPSGVVNDQIWSNTRFRVCLKVQDENDSKEMLKRPEAAYIKQAGRYYLQVGYDEYFALGQSGYSGAKYYPSDKIIKQVDKSLNFVDDNSQIIKSICASKNTRGEPQGEQLQAVMKLIIDVSNKVNKKSRRLWLENIPEIILEEDIEKKYNFTNEKVEAVIGEYDAPEDQEQGIVKYNLMEDGNTIIYGNDSIEKEMILNTIIYSLTKNYSPDIVNFYMLDFGSESLKSYEKIPHFSGYANISEENRISNLFTILEDEIAKRKKKFSEYGGEYSKYIENTKETMPLLVVIINNFDTMKDNFDNLVYDTLPDITRDSERYGIIFVVTATGTNSVRMNVSQNFKHFYTFKLKDKYEYQMIFNKKKDLFPRDIIGRGIIDNGSLHEFQVAQIAAENSDDFIRKFINESKEKYKDHKTYLELPTLPDNVREENVINYLSDLKKVPVGISKETVEIQYFDFITNLGSIICGNTLDAITPFTNSLISLITKIKNINIFVIDPKKLLQIDKSAIPNYYTENLEEVAKKIKEYIDKLISNNSSTEGLLVINGIDELVKKVSDIKILEDLTESLKNYEKIGTVFIETNSKFKNHISSKWLKNVSSNSNGIWVGNGMGNQTTLMCTTNRAMSLRIKNNAGYIITDGTSVLCQILDFYTKEDD